MQKLTFRTAEKNDADLALDFIRQLADYEHMLNEVVADKAVFEDEVFNKKRAEILFAVYDGREVGMALYFHNFSTFLGHSGIYLEDLFVLPGYRGKGIGTAIFHELAKIAVSEGCGRLEWWCLDWNKPSIEFYKNLGAEPMDDWTVYRLCGEKLKALSE